MLLLFFPNLGTPIGLCLNERLFGVINLGHLDQLGLSEKLNLSLKPNPGQTNDFTIGIHSFSA